MIETKKTTTLERAAVVRMCDEEEEDGNLSETREGKDVYGEKDNVNIHCQHMGQEHEKKRTMLEWYEDEEDSSDAISRWRTFDDRVMRRMRRTP